MFRPRSFVIIYQFIFYFLGQNQITNIYLLNDVAARFWCIYCDIRMAISGIRWTGAFTLTVKD